MNIKWNNVNLDGERVIYGNAVDRELDCVIVPTSTNHYTLYLNVTKGSLLNKTEVDYEVSTEGDVKVEAHKILEKLV